MNNRFGVIIPYYQYKRGLLRKAVDSIKHQTINESINLIIVDDSSPHPAKQELIGWDPGPRIQLTLIEQPNSGSGRARNKGIDNMPSHIEYIAFLDSDDYWGEDHLKNASRAFEAGADLYFSNYLDIDGRIAMSSLKKRCNSYYDQFNSENSLWQTKGDSLQMIILHGYATTPTIVYHYCRFKSIRFPFNFCFYGEDQTFWLKLAINGAKAIFSTNVEVFGGSGVNIYSVNTWGTEKQVWRTNHEIRFRKYCLKTMSLAPEAQRFIKQQLMLVRRKMIPILLHHLRRRALLLVLKQIYDDPFLLLYFPVEITSAIRTR